MFTVMLFESVQTVTIDPVVVGWSRVPITTKSPTLTLANPSPVVKMLAEPLFQVQFATANGLRWASALCSGAGTEDHAGRPPTSTSAWPSAPFGRLAHFGVEFPKMMSPAATAAARVSPWKADRRPTVPQEGSDPSLLRSVLAAPIGSLSHFGVAFPTTSAPRATAWATVSEWLAPSRSAFTTAPHDGWKPGPLDLRN